MHGHSAHDAAGDMSLPPEPSKPDVGKGRLIVILAIATSIMQGLFVTGSSHEMHLWADPQQMATGAAPWTPESANKMELPPANLPQQ